MHKLHHTIIYTLLSIILFSCQNEKKLTKNEISTVTKEHQMVYVWSLNAIVNEANEVSDFIFGGVEKGSLTEAHKQLLEEWWGIKTKRELLTSIHALQQGEMHHASFMKEYDGFFDLTEVEFQKNLKENPDYNTIDSLLWKNKTLFKEKGILAWDIVRASALIGWGYQAEYLSLEEAYDLCLTTGQLIQRYFDSHQTLMDNYLVGYLYWSQDVDAYTERTHTVKQLLDDPESAWNVFPFDYEMTKK